MAKYKDYSYEQTLMIPVSFEKRILPGSLEYILSHLIDDQIDMSIFALQKQTRSNDQWTTFWQSIRVRTKAGITENREKLYCPGRLFYNLLGLAAHMVHNIGKVRIEWS